MRHLFLPIVALASIGAATPSVQPALRAAIASPARTPANVARDRYRHPGETLAFFGVKPSDTVVEIWPSGGWYTEILAPYLARRGSYVAAVPSEKAAASLRAKNIAPAIRYATFPSNDPAARVPAGSADVVLTFRNVHNWRFGANGDQTQAAFDQMFAMLKPGGTLGLVEHHLPEGSAIKEAESGYMKRSTVLAYATKAGFRFVGESMVNANSKDTHDYPKGVWTLPPTYTAGDADRARYAAIGESDRMTLKFVRPR